MNEKIKQLRSQTAGIQYSNFAVSVEGKLVVRADGKLVATEEDRTIKGYACVWGVVDSYGTIFRRGAFAKSIQERGPDSASKYKIVLLWQHEMHNPIGQVRVLREDDYGLYFEAVADDIPEGIRAVKQVRSGTINQFSFGFTYVWDALEWNDELDVIEVREASLYEISPVTIAANRETFALRSATNPTDALADLNSEMDEFIRTIPRNKQLELRNLIASYVSLCNFPQPQQVSRTALEERAEPDASDGIDYAYISQNLKL